MWNLNPVNRVSPRRARFYGVEGRVSNCLRLTGDMEMRLDAAEVEAI